jgi:hypothetical protein
VLLVMATCLQHRTYAYSDDDLLDMLSMLCRLKVDCNLAVIHHFVLSVSIKCLAALENRASVTSAEIVSQLLSPDTGLHLPSKVRLLSELQDMQLLGSESRVVGAAAFSLLYYVCSQGAAKLTNMSLSRDMKVTPRNSLTLAGLAEWMQGKGHKFESLALKRPMTSAYAAWLLQAALLADISACAHDLADSSQAQDTYALSEVFRKTEVNFSKQMSTNELITQVDSELSQLFLKFSSLKKLARVRRKSMAQ